MGDNFETHNFGDGGSIRFNPETKEFRNPDGTTLEFPLQVAERLAQIVQAAAGPFTEEQLHGFFIREGRNFGVDGELLFKAWQDSRV